MDLDNEELEATVNRNENDKYIIHLTDEQYRKVIENAQKDIKEKYTELLNGLIDEYHKRVQEKIDLEQDIKILQDDLEDKRLVYIDTPEFQDSYIPKQKIKDKIEDLEKKMKYEQNERVLIHLQKQRKILKELLEE